MSELVKVKRPFFVYGTLLPGQPNYYLLEYALTNSAQATIHDCQLYDMGPYPMMVEAPGVDTVGMVMDVDDAFVADVTANLDMLEGYDPQNHDSSAYKRVLRKVKLENGRFVEAWVYLGAKTFVNGMEPIDSGDWRQHMRTKQAQISHWWETIETVAGLHQSEE